MIIFLDYEINGNKNKLLDKKLYEDIIFPYKFNIKDLNIEIINDKVKLTIKNLKIKNKEEIIDNFNDKYIEFGKNYYYDENKKIYNKEDIEITYKSYYILDNIILPVNNKYNIKNCNFFSYRKPIYFYEDVILEKYNDDYYININRIPTIFKNKLNFKNKLPKKYHKDIIESNEYLFCQSPEKYRGKRLLTKNNINSLFIREDNHKIYYYKKNIIYKGKLNYILFKNIKI